MALRPRRVRFDNKKGAFPKVRTVGQHTAPHEDLYYYILSRPWWQFGILLFAAFLLANLSFAAAYSLQPGAIANARPGSFEDAFFFSVQTLATIGYGTMSPATRYAHILVAIESFIGILCIALLTGITFAKFSRPSARVLFSERVVVNPRDGVPHMSFRMANWRHNAIIEAQLRVILLVLQRTAEGDVMRVPIEVPLVRDRTATLFLTWTAMHRIDESSPFYGADALARLREQDGALYVSLSGMDETVSQTVHARYSYSLDDIAWDAHFADVIDVLPDGTRVLNYHKFHEVVTLEERARGAGESQGQAGPRRV